MKPRLRENLLSSVLVLTVAAPMSYVAHLSLGMQFSGWYILLFAAVSLIILDITAWNRITAIAVPAAAVLLCLAAWLTVGEQERQALTGFFGWAIHFICGGWTYSYGWGLALTAAATFLTTFYVWLFGKKFFCFPAVFVFVVAFVLYKWMVGLDEVLVPGVLACGGLVPLWAKSFQRRTAKRAKKATPENGMALYLLPIAAMIVLIGLLSVTDVSSRKWQSHGVNDMFQRVNNYLADYTNFNRPRNSFSIGTFGLMPRGILGGPVKLADIDVMQVDAPGRMLLRGTIYNAYTGTYWGSTLDSKRYRFSGKTDGIREDAFDMSRPALSGADKKSFDRFVTSLTIHVQPIINCPSTLFVPGRGVTSVTSDKFLAVLPYYNATGEVFSSSDVLAQYGYTVKADYLNYTAPGFNDEMDALLALGLKDTPEWEQFISKNYLALPDGIDKSVYSLTKKIITGQSIRTISAATSEGNTIQYTETEWTPPPIHNDYDKALAIKDFLVKNFQYTLSPATPPEGADFVSYFLCQDQKGYCTYFASAMAVMARIAGIPSRYVEGYLMPDKDVRDPYYAINGKNAHAWAELYFEGVGWIPFDATPGSAGAGGDSGSIGFVYPVPTPPAHVEPPSGLNSVPAYAGPDWGKIAAWLWTLPAAAGAFVILWALRILLKAKEKVSLRNVQKRYADRRLQCAFYYFELLRLLEYYDRPVMQSETPYAFAARVDRWLILDTGKFADAADLIALISYSDYVPTAADVGFMARFHRELAKNTLKATGLPFYLWHHIFGLGRKGLNRRRGL